MKSYFYLFIGLLFFYSCSSKDIDSSKESEEPIESEVITKNRDSFGSAQKLLRSFESGVSVRAGELTYPDYYGGCYINDDGELVILIKEDSAIPRSTIIDITDNDDVIIETCQYSEKELREVYNEINEYMLANFKEDPLAKNIIRVRLDIKENCVTVYLDDYNEAIIQQFKSSIIDSPIVKFTKSPGSITPHANLYAGHYASAQPFGSSSYYPCTIGFRAKYNGITGIVTAGHAFSSYGDYILDASSKKTIGYPTFMKQSGTVDVAFCSLMDFSWNLTNTINGINKVLNVTILPYPVLGAYIEKVGSASGYTSGYITAISEACWVGSAYLTDMMASSMASLGGDSGGIVYAQSGSYYYIMGIHTSGSTFEAWATKATNIYNEGIRPY